LGAHVGETEILSAAGKSFAFTIPNLIYFEGVSFLLLEHSCSNNQFEIKKKREERISNFGLGINLTNQKLIMKHCVPIVQLSDKTGYSA
jgi:hypothetical protein